jgi:hypothetical protein
MFLVSFDIDGTLETGEPSGPVSLELVRQAKLQGCVIGSASDRTLGEQRRMWASAGIVADFVSLKHRLRETTLTFGCTRRLHIGDTPTDEHYARLAGFEYLPAASFAQVANWDWTLLRGVRGNLLQEHRCQGVHVERGGHAQVRAGRAEGFDWLRQVGRFDLINGDVAVRELGPHPRGAALGGELRFGDAEPAGRDEPRDCQEFGHVDVLVPVVVLRVDLRGRRAAEHQKNPSSHGNSLGLYR